MNIIKQIRKKHNLSVAQLAEKLGVSRNAVYCWERGDVPLSKRALSQLEALGYVEIKTIPEQVKIRVKE